MKKINGGEEKERKRTMVERRGGETKEQDVGEGGKDRREVTSVLD